MPAPSKKPPARALPDDALRALRKLCEGTSQGAVARRLDVASSTISQALNGRYIGNVERLAERIRGELLNEKVDCPFWGEITSRICQDQRERPLIPGNPLYSAVWRTCRTCPRNPKAEPQA